MAFWNRKQKQNQNKNQKTEVEKRTNTLQQKIDANLEEEAAELFRELDVSQRKVKEKEEKRKKTKEQAEKTELYDTETVFPQKKEDQKQFVTECCENIRDVDRQISNIREEYEQVTNSLLDIQKIDRMEQKDKKALKQAATQIVNLMNERNKYKNRNLTISDAVIRRFEPFRDELVSEIKKMYEAENYQRLIEKDMELLQAEKQMLRIEQGEVVERQNALKGLAKGLLVIIAAIFLMFGTLYLLLEIDLTFPYLATISLAAVSSAVIFIETQKNRRSMSLATRKLEKAIGLLNRVKIKCVNNLNLLEYNRQKFGVANAAAFEANWVEYCKEKEYERKFRENTERLNLCSVELRDILNDYELVDAEIWVSQAIAIIDDREMVEIRHKLNQRRQMLREQIEYNENAKQKFVGNIDALLKKYPENREELVEIVQRFSL